MKLNNKVFINITLPEHYVTELKLTAYEEMRVASNKYNVNLTQEEKENVFEHSFNQLEAKIKEISRTEWEIGHPVLSIRVDHYKDEEINLPEDMKDHSGKKVLRESKKWSFDTEDNKDAIAIEELEDEIMIMLDKFLRTAIMYGVGSYA